MNLRNLSRKQKVLAGLGAFMLVGLIGSAFDSSAPPETTAAVEQPKAQTTVEPKTPAQLDADAKSAKEAAEKAKEAAKAEAAKPTTAQSNAVRSAENYLDFSAFSRSGLIKQLAFEGYDKGDASYAVDNIDVSWRNEAAESAKSYLEMSAFSRSGLLKQLAFEGYTPAQATYGVNQTGL